MSALVVNYNADAANAVLNLDSTNYQLSQAIGQLSSGLAVQYSDQGPAAWSISQYLQYQNAGDSQGVSNATQGVAVLNIASGAMNQVGQILDQMEQLAASSANGGAMTAAQYAANNTQYKALWSEVISIVDNTTYGTTSLLNGTYTGETFQVGFQASDTMNVTINNLLTALNIVGGTILNPFQAHVNMNILENTSIPGLTSISSQIGSAQDQLQAFVQDLQTMSTNVQAANSSVVDANMAQKMTEFTTDQILLQSGLAMLGQAQANPTLVLKLL